mgnify:CR=1 FL=1
MRIDIGDSLTLGAGSELKLKNHDNSQCFCQGLDLDQLAPVRRQIVLAPTRLNTAIQFEFIDSR